MSYKDIIVNNYKFYQLFKLIMLFERNVHQKLKLIENLVTFMIWHPAGVYSDYYIERILHKIGKKIVFTNMMDYQPDTVLHVATTVWGTGGHTRLIWNWMKFDEKRRHSLVVTQPENAMIPKFIWMEVMASGGRIYNLREENYIKKTEKLLEIAKRFDKIILHTNAEDVIPCMAFSHHNWKRPVYAVNQEDFAFSMWSSVADMVFNITRFDRCVTEHIRKAKKSVYLPLPIDKVETMVFNEQEVLRLRNEYNIPEEAKVVATMARAIKYTIIEGYNFPEFCRQLLEQEDVHMLVVGVNKKEKGWERVSSKYADRLHLLGSIPMNEVRRLWGVTDVYVDSFPESSYTCMLEAAAAQIPVCGLKGVWHSDEFKIYSASTVTELIEGIQTLLKNAVRHDYTKELEKHYKRLWTKELEKYYAIPLRHTVKKFETSYKCTDYEYIYVQMGKSRRIGFSKEGLSWKNRMAVELFERWEGGEYANCKISISAARG